MINGEMKSVFNSNRHRHVIVGSLLAILTLGVSFASIVSVVRGYTFPGGNGGGCTSMWCTGPGNVNAGWKIFALNGGGPGGNNGRGFVNNSPTTWATVQSNCNRYPGITKAYIFVTQAIGASSPYLGLNYLSGMPGVPGYQDASPSGAKTFYDEAVAYDPGTASGSWGSSVAAFCYYDNPPWNVSVTSTANKIVAEPGEKIIWTHRITNSGPNTTNRAVTWRSQDRGWSNTPGTTNWTFASGSGRNATANNSSEYTVSAADFGRQVCRSTYAAPANNIGGATESVPACVAIGKKPKVQIHGGDLIVGRRFSDGAASNGTSIVETSQTVKLR